MGMIQQSTYSASGGPNASPAGATVTVIEINGFLAGSVQVTGFWVDSDSPINLALVRTSTLAAGASIADTAVPHDPLNLAASAGIRHFTVAPVNGVIIGGIRSFNPGAAGVAPLPIDYRFGFRDLLSQPIVLRGATDALILLQISAISSLLRFAIEWNEDI